MLRIYIFLSCFIVSVYTNQWNYGHLGPDIWSDYYPLCAGKSQSPINILTACTTYKTYPSFEYFPTYNHRRYFTLKNNGHTVVGYPTNSHEQLPIRLKGGGLNGTFDFVNFHLHWGENYKSGSEHQM